jgi:uncharacterized protein DUF29
MTDHGDWARGQLARSSVASACTALLDLMEDSPSLRRIAEESRQRVYREAVELALIETDLTVSAKELNVPRNCPYTSPPCLKATSMLSGSASDGSRESESNGRRYRKC